MDIFKKIMNVMSQNLGYTVVLVVAIVLFAIFSGGLVAGLITAGSALVAYACIDALYKQYKAAPAPTTPKKKATRKK